MGKNKLEINSHRWFIFGGDKVCYECDFYEFGKDENVERIVVNWAYAAIQGYTFYVTKHSKTECWHKNKTNGKWERWSALLPEEESWGYVEKAIENIRETYEEVYEIHQNRSMVVMVDVDCMLNFVDGLRMLGVRMDKKYNHWIDNTLIGVLSTHYSNCDKELISKSVHELCEKLDNIANGTKK